MSVKCARCKAEWWVVVSGAMNIRIPPERVSEQELKEPENIPCPRCGGRDRRATETAPPRLPGERGQLPLLPKHELALTQSFRLGRLQAGLDVLSYGLEALLKVTRKRLPVLMIRLLKDVVASARADIAGAIRDHLTLAK